MISIVFQDLDKLMQVIQHAREQILPDVKAVVSRGALNVKNAAKAAAPDPHHAGLYKASITYTLTVEGDTVSAEIGPDKDKPQGALGNLLEFGGVKGGSKPHLVPSWDDEEKKLDPFVADAAVKLLQ
jgi:hypothetical protein